jgi:long-chain acyl-CoA synthetase
MHVLLISGATGAIGSLLVDRLAARGDVERVYALVHETPLQSSSPKVRQVAGDIRRPLLGLAQADVDELTATITGIVHAAADTRFTAPPDELRAANVDGTQNVLDFAARCRRLDRLGALSTVYVAGKRTGDVFESELEHDAGFVNAYEASKYEAESLLRAWQGRLPIAVIRSSTAIGDSETGRVGRLGAIHQALRLMYRSLAPLMPGRADHPVDVVPLDYVVKAVERLFAGAFQPGATYHVCAGDDALSQSELLDVTFEAFGRLRPAWRKRAIERPAIVDLDTFERFRQSVEAIGDSALRDSTSIVASFAPQLGYPKRFDDAGCRAALGGIARPSVCNSYARTIQYLLESQRIK